MVETIILQYQETVNPDVPKREASRGILVKENQCLMVHVPLEHAYMFPGGGIEEGETFDECLIREFREETGYILESYEKFLIIEEHFDDLIYINHYYKVEASTLGAISHTLEELRQQLESVWVQNEVMHEVLTASLPIMVRTMHARELVAWTQYLRNIQKKHD